MVSTINELAIKDVLSPARISTYEAAVVGSPATALELYSWNAQVSGALLTPLHICEVAIRNAIALAIESIYGSNWPWSSGFERSLPNPKVGYNPKVDLFNARLKLHSTGKVIPELKFVFWERMLTGRYDHRIWNGQLLKVFPNLNPNDPISVSRKKIYDGLEQIRKLRNRIAHHEPIFTRNLTDDLAVIASLIEYRCFDTAKWMRSNQSASAVIQAKP